MTDTAFVDRVAAEVPDVRFVRVLLSVIAAVFWLIGAVFGVVWFVVRWCWAAIKVGWRDTQRNVTDDAG